MTQMWEWNAQTEVSMYFVVKSLTILEYTAKNSRG